MENDKCLKPPASYSSIVETTATSQAEPVCHTLPRPLEARLPCTPGKVPNPGCPSLNLEGYGQHLIIHNTKTHTITRSVYIYMLKSLIYSNLEDYHIAYWNCPALTFAQRKWADWWTQLSQKLGSRRAPSSSVRTKTKDPVGTGPTCSCRGIFRKWGYPNMDGLWWKIHL